MEEKTHTLLLEKEEQKVDTVEPETPKFEEKVQKNEEKVQKKPNFAQTRQKQSKRVSLAIERPNYDFIEELNEEQVQKVYKVEKGEKQKKPNSFSRKLRVALLCLVIGVCSIWGIVNIAKITTLNAQIESASTVYDLRLRDYLTKLATLDSASSANDLFPTYPQEVSSPTSVKEKSNWFDRLCNFIAGLFS